MLISRSTRRAATFAASPPHSDFSADGLNAKEACEHTLHRFLKDRLPSTAKNNLKIFALHKMAVAQIAYHREYLDQNLHHDNILRSSSLWNDDIPFEDKIVVKYPWDATDDTPEITGLPPDTVLLAKLESMQLKMKAMLDEQHARFESTLNDQLDRRQVGGSNYARGDEILTKLETLMEQMAEVSRTAQVSVYALT